MIYAIIGITVNFMELYYIGATSDIELFNAFSELGTQHSFYFPMCSAFEEVEIAEIGSALDKLESGAQFAFYSLNLSNEERAAFSQISVNRYHNVVIYLSEQYDFESYLRSRLYDVLCTTEVEISNINIISHTIARLIHNILDASGYIDAEILLRTEEKFSIDDADANSRCFYWHIDKSHGEILEKLDITNHPIGHAKEQELFILPLKGEATLFQNINVSQREIFLSVANETEYFYGHNLGKCDASDSINVLFNGGHITSAPKWYGSVHIAGKNGTLHASPNESVSGRMLLFYSFLIITFIRGI